MDASISVICKIFHFNLIIHFSSCPLVCFLGEIDAVALVCSLEILPELVDFSGQRVEHHLAQDPLVHCRLVDDVPRA